MFTIVFGALASVLALTSMLLVRKYFPTWWERQTVRVFGWFLVFLPLAGLICFVGGVETGGYGVYRVGKIAVAAGLVIAFPLFFALLISHLIVQIGERRRCGNDKTESENTASRRRFLKAALVAPTTSLGLSATGLIASSFAPEVLPLDVAVKGLDSRLEGLRILHVTDAHLGPFVSLSDFESVVAALADNPPDVIVVTGDFSDFVRLVTPGLNVLRQLKPKLGVFASMGNHEYHFDLKELRQAYEKAQVPLLVDQGVTLKHQGASFYLAGADDPAKGGLEKAAFLERSVASALRDQPSDVPTVLMSHRPPGFNAAAKYGIELTLAGHTHGFQMGIAGRSVGELFAPTYYPRGFYRKGESSLYTSAGFGHWFPFRLGCAREAPVIRLTRKS